MQEELIKHLSQFITENKRQKIEEALQYRTYYLTVVLEDIYQAHNASAVVRTCDCFGIQQMHVIENRNQYKVNPDVTLGSSKWVDIIHHNKAEQNTRASLESLKSAGYRLIATTPHKDDTNLEDLPLDSKTALLFGTEKEGLSQEALELADGFVKIPMFGFTESLNISVSAAICIHQLSMKLRNSDIDWRLTDQEKNVIRLNWIRGIVQRSELLEKDFLNNYKEGKNVD
ncbi:MAG: TrmH family RNA methyltransferase [Cytophagaceae bacterium]